MERARSLVQPFVVSLGDPAGIGPEITAKAWEARTKAGLLPFFAVGDIDSIRAVWDGPIRNIESAGEVAEIFDEALPVWHLDSSGPITPGQPTHEGALIALKSLEVGAGLARSGVAGALITAPVSKSQLYKVGFNYPGQTEFVAEHCGVSRSNATMMLAGPGLRVVPVTIHVPYKDVPALLTVELIKARAHATARGLTRNFGIANPRLAIAGLNPHAGENGDIGREEIDIVAPAVTELLAEGIDITGPHTPDAMFTPWMRDTYDAALCLYHDQGLIPLKALYFDEGVNMTLGLSIIRTSPDHGTAFAIAGEDKAHPGAMIAAVRMAAEAARNRALVDV